MLKGKKKMLAAQVLLGLMVAGNAYAADFTVEGVDGGSWGEVASADSKGAQYHGYACNVTSKPLLGPAGAFNPGVFEDGKSVVSDYNIKLDVNLVGSLDSNFLLDADIVKNNKISFGVGYPRGYQNWSGSTWNVFKPDVSKDNTLELGIIFNDKHNDSTGKLENFLENINVGDENDIVLAGGRANDYQGVEYVADYENIGFTGRNLTLEDADGTDKIKSADMKGDIKAARALNVTEGISAGGDIIAEGGLTAGKGISAGGSITGGALKAASISAGDFIESTGDIIADTLIGNGISAKGAIKIQGAINALNGSSMNRVAGGDISANTITAGSINASSVTVNGDITTGSINVTGNVEGANITINNGASNVGGTLKADGTLKIEGNSKLNAGKIQLTGNDKLKINSTATGTILSAGSVVDSSGNAIDMSQAVNTSNTTTKTEGLFTKVYGTAVSGSSVTSGVVGTTLNENSKSVVETQIASLAGVITSADLLSNAGFSNASQAVQQSNAEGGSAREMVPYAAVGYGNMRQESGSHVDVQGSAFNIGFAKEVKNGSGKLLFGPMIEYGRGSYESYLDDGTKGDGNTQNFGLGVMARQNNDNGTYYEGSLRYGKLTSNYNSGDLGADYDTDANYWGAHLGLGKVFQLNDKNSIDTYCKFFYTNQGSSSANISGSNVEFDAVKSKRSRLGFRFNHATSDVRSIYAGLAWQHEFDGSACATVDGFSTPSPSIKGNSMMVELGVNVAPKSSPVSFDLGVSGWAGKQKGYSLNANMLWSF